MHKLDRTIRTLFAFALGLSVGFPLGILGIIFGAREGIIPLLVAGIVLTVAGFYVMPLLWLRYAERRQDRTVLRLVERDGMLTVAAIAAQLGHREEDVRARLQRLIRADMLVGYRFREDRLFSNDPSSPSHAGRKHLCASCGAAMVPDGAGYLCEYCGNREA